MNTISQIENALKAIDGAPFQNLIKHLLHLQGYKLIGAPGAVVGKEKTRKGSPDAFFIDADKYIFVECTTKTKLGKSRSFFEKLSNDVDHCFDESSTGISKEKIEKIILACTETISPNEHRLLMDKVKGYNNETAFEIFNIQNLPLILYDYPKLAKEYLSIEIIKGEIFTLEEFLLKTTKGLQPSLINEFFGRGSEVKKCIEALKRSDKLLLSGSSGVGRSKLAVKLMEELSTDNFISVVIQSSAIPLWDDFMHLFQAGKKYVVLYDDANKSIQNLNYLLSIVEAPTPFVVKLIITCRDYVKNNVLISLEEHNHEEVTLFAFEDKEIEEIILRALPALINHFEIKRKIVELSKGNARLALMATYSVTPDAETNYLTSPVLLYEKYFKKIADEIGVFNEPVVLKELAIVSFFGVLDKNNEQLKEVLSKSFGINWNELWSAIMELHAAEILDVHSNDVVKVADQVLSSYAFYKCFIDPNSSVISYAQWMVVFLDKYAYRIKSTLIEANNTFEYWHVKDLVVPHLNEVLKNPMTDDKLYSYYQLFWFYKGRACLFYLENWVATLSDQQAPVPLSFTYVHNNHTKASKHFELLINFLDTANELLKPSLKIMLALVEKQPERLSEILKFINDKFTYKLADIDTEFIRQNMFFDILLNEDVLEPTRKFADGIFLNSVGFLLGWHFTEFASGKKSSFTFYNFNLDKSVALMRLRERMLDNFILLFDAENQQTQKVLDKIVFPGGAMDKSVYVDELHIYDKLVSEKLNKTLYAHDMFVRTLAKHLTSAGSLYPENWNSFINSDIMKLSQFLKPARENRDDKSIDVAEREKRAEYDDFIKKKDWVDIEKFLLSVNALYAQKTESFRWEINSAITDIYISIAKKGSAEFEYALRLAFSGTVNFPLMSQVLNYPLQNHIINGADFYTIVNEYEFSDKNYWLHLLLSLLPEEQVDANFLVILLTTFETSGTGGYSIRMTDYLKFNQEFKKYLKENSGLDKHNVITYLTSLILSSSERGSVSFGYHFCQDCAQYFTDHMHLLRKAYLIQKKNDEHFDHDGKELEAVLKLDNNFFIEFLDQKEVNFDYLNLKLEDFKLDFIWELPGYEKVLNKSMEIIIAKSPHFSNWEHPAATLFTFRNQTTELYKKAIGFLENYLNGNSCNEQRVLVVMNILLNRYKKDFVPLLKNFLQINNDLEIFKGIYLSTGGVFSGSRVPKIQSEIDLSNEIIGLINQFPNTLSYSGHIDYLENYIVALKKDIQQEKRREFEEEIY